jgi:putative transposase
MKRKRFSEEQITGVLKEVAAGAKTLALCRRHGVSKQTFYGRKAKYGGLEVSEVRCLRQLEDENGRLKRSVADRNPRIRSSTLPTPSRPVCRGGTRRAKRESAYCAHCGCDG